MSLHRYSARIRPDTRLRAAVLLSGALLCLAGLYAILSLPLPALIRGAIAAGWFGLCAAEWRVAASGFARARGYELRADGSVVVLGAGDRRTAARFAAGSVVLRGAAWLRLRTDAGVEWADTVAASGCESEQWRRFQVICRHVSPC